MPLTTKIYFKTIFFKNFSGTLTQFQYFSISDIFMHANIYLPFYMHYYIMYRNKTFFFSKKFCFFNSWTKKCKRSFSVFLMHIYIWYIYNHKIVHNFHQIFYRILWFRIKQWISFLQLLLHLVSIKKNLDLFQQSHLDSEFVLKQVKKEKLW